nr:primosomal protein DnaI [Bacillota bacterium]
MTAGLAALDYTSCVEVTVRMKSVHQLFPSAYGGREQLAEKWRQLRETPEVQALLRQYPHLPDAFWQRAVLRLEQFVQEQRNCQRCPGLKQCPNLMAGHRSEVHCQPPYLHLSYRKCPLLRQEELVRQQSALIRSHYVPEEILSASFETIERDLPRLDALNAVMEFCLTYEVGKRMPGIYLYGPLGVGKSRMMGAACRSLAERGIPSIMVYLPEFLREVKDAIHDGRVQEKVEALQRVPVLVLDDIGAETVSAWVRDEILGTILQSRVAAGLPTMYTSNLNYDELEEHFSYSYKDGVDEMKAKRIMERIRYETRAYYVGGENRRKQKWQTENVSN